MLVACWSTKGGVGTTVVASSLAILHADRSEVGALAVDLTGDVPTALGVANPPTGSASASGSGSRSPGVADWLARAPDVPPDALLRLEIRAGPRLSLVPRGDGLLRAGPGADALAALLVDEPRPVVVDCGRIDAPSPDADVALGLAAGATRSLLVLRPCFMALRRARDALVRPSGVVLLTEPRRSLSVHDVESTLDVPVVARVRVTDTVARAIDAGLLAHHVPRTLAKDLRHAAA